MRLFLLLSLSATCALAQVSKTTVTLAFPNCSGSTPASYDVDVYRPSGAGPFGLVGIGHGFQNSKDNHEVFARALAAKGVVVVVPQFPLLLALQCGSSDHSRNADILWAAMEQERGVSTIDPARVGLAGHSAGGLSAFLAASRHAVDALLLFDAVDNNGLGAAATSNVTPPTLFLAAESSTCNSSNNSLPWFDDLTGLKGKLKVVGATHCEPQDPLSNTCTAACGGSTQQARQALFRTYGLAFFDRFLNGVTMPCLEATAQTDATAGVVADVDLQFGGCGAMPDAGSVEDAGSAFDGGAGAEDAGSASDAGAVTDGGAGADDAGSASDAGAGFDGGPGADDAGAPPDTDAGATQVDAGSLADGGTDPGTPPPAGCGCGSAGAWAAALSLTVLLLRRRGAPGVVS